MATRFIKTCDCCREEYGTDDLGTNGRMFIERTHVESMHESINCGLDLCGSMSYKYRKIC